MTMQNVQNPPVSRMNTSKEVHLFIASFCIFGCLLWDSQGVHLFISEPEMIVGNSVGLNLVTFFSNLVTLLPGLVPLNLCRVSKFGHCYIRPYAVQYGLSVS